MVTSSKETIYELHKSQDKWPEIGYTHDQRITVTSLDQGSTRVQVDRKGSFSFPSFGFGLAEEPNLPPNKWEQKDIIIMPENPNPEIMIGVIPGFGHSSEKDNLGANYETWAMDLSEKNSTTTMIAVESHQEPHGSTAFQIPGIGRSRALLIGLLNLPEEVTPRNPHKIILVGHSNNCYDTLVAANRCQVDLGMEVNGIVFVAPTANPYDLITTFRKAGRPVEVDVNSNFHPRVGSRGTLADSTFMDFQTWEPVNGYVKAGNRNIRLLGEKLSSTIPITTLHGIGDPIVSSEDSQSFADKVGSTFQEIHPDDSLGSEIHNFVGRSMRQAISDAVRKMI